MKSLTIDETLSVADYERVRGRLRPLFIAEKDRRRLLVGENLNLLFENDRTVWYQVQEMIRTERISDSAAIQHELDTYNELIPGRGELSATLLIQFDDTAERDRRLRELVGLEQHLWMKIGTRRIRARFDASQMSDDRISSVQFIRFAVGVDTTAFIDSAKSGQVLIEADHPQLAVSATLDGRIAEVLAADLAQS
jgi:hypothetical protein